LWILFKYTMRTHALVLLLATWQAAILPLIQADSPLIFESSPQPAPELSPSPSLDVSPASPATSNQESVPPDYLPKPPDESLISPSPDLTVPPSPPPPAFPLINPSNLPSWVVSKQSAFFLREHRRNVALISKIDQKNEQADVFVYGDSITALNAGINLATGVKGSRIPWNSYFGDLNAEPLGIPGDRIGNLMWRLAIGQERSLFKDPKVRSKIEYSI
jgi:hypothetical protein